MDEAIMRSMREEDDILIRAALRFAGWEYIDGRRFDVRTAIEAWEDQDHRDFGELEMLAMFFNMQRYLYKWGGEMLPRDSRSWKTFRELFLATANVEVPEEYRDQKRWKEWSHIDRPVWPERIALIRRIHETIEYGASGF